MKPSVHTVYSCPLVSRHCLDELLHNQTQSVVKR